MKKIITLISALSATQAFAGTEVPQPFYIGDMNPLTMNYGAPLSGMPANLHKGQWQWQLGVSISNTLHNEVEASETLTVDAETQRQILAVDVGLTENWDFRVEVPFIDHGEGSLDSFVEDFHDTFGFPQGGRDKIAKDQFDLQYTRDGVTLLDTQSPSSGMGDVSLALVRRIKTDVEDDLSVGVQLKLPTGDVDDLTGTDTHDLALWVNASSEITRTWDHYASLGGVYIEKDEGLLADIRNTGYYFFSYGVQWKPNQYVSFKAQADVQSDVYKDSETRLLGHSTSLALGGTVHMPRQFDLDIAVVEDVDVGTSPDVVFHLNLRKRYGW